MKTIVKGRNLEVDDQLRAYVERKMSRLDRVAHRGAEATVELRSHASHSSDDASVVDVTILLNGDVLHSISTAATPQAALDTVLDKLERQIVRHNEKLRVREKSAEEMNVLQAAAQGELDTDDGAAPRVVRVKRFDMEPMFEEDAVARMEELGHAFFIFLNAETDGVCLLYRRRDGNYGLIEPAVAGSRGRRPG